MIRDQETINALVDIIERFVRERLIPAEEQMAEEGKLPDDLLQEMREPLIFIYSVNSFTARIFTACFQVTHKTAMISILTNAELHKLIAKLGGTSG